MGAGSAKSCLAAAPLAARDSENRAKQLAYPIASLTSVPVQLDYDGGI